MRVVSCALCVMLCASTGCCLAVSVAVGVVSTDLLVVLRLPAAIRLGVMVTICHFPVYSGCLILRIFRT